MIRIVRPEQAPTVLLGAGEQETHRNCESYGLNEEAYRSGSETFTFRRSIYAHTTVKDALLQTQHDKCCYCESKFLATSFGAVEHFRPKGAVKQEHGATKQYPGYYWLAYSWGNLLVSCESCNTKYKGSLFPLVDEESRARSHHVNIEVESPLFVDPASEDPGHHIQFRRAEVAFLTERGLRTIQGFGLARSKLEDARAEELDRVEIFCSVVEHLQDDVDASLVEDARRYLTKAIRPEAAFSAMARDFLSSRGFDMEGE